MQLKYKKTIKNRIVLIELETTNFLPREVTALEKFGEPVIKLSKMYMDVFPVEIDRKIRTGFKVRVKFDGTEDLDLATDAANLFFEEVQELLSARMGSLMEQLDELEADFVTDSGFVDIKY